ncbi:uncharacterized protein LOC143204648 isoform X1 [Rhynchophorus ferrugineus]|uniref:uncharacterized protein LOC143204648 isoform X1 n=2 Tax=Rhynchophorus ferrugineus TaxID=354439 RepID=UPI003FCD82DE
MDFNYFSEGLELQWKSIFEKQLPQFSCQNEDKSLTFEDILKRIFDSDQPDYDIKYEDKERCQRSVIEGLHFITVTPLSARQSKWNYLLNIMSYVLRDETCFIDLDMNGVLKNVFFMMQSTQMGADKSSKLMFAHLVRSCLEHETGVKWVVNSQNWIYHYNVVLEYQDDREVTDVGYDLLMMLLEKVIKIDQKMFQDIIYYLSKPMEDTVMQCNAINPNSIMSLDYADGSLSLCLISLVEILERLLKNNSERVLNGIIHCKIGAISERLLQIVKNKDICLLLERIRIILSFYGLSEIFDGIKSINQDPLLLSGFLKTIERKVDEGELTQVLDLYYYGLKYAKYISDKLPNYNMNGKPLNTECELLGLQLEPIILVAAKLENVFWAPEKVESIRMSHLIQILKKLSLECLQLVYKIKKIMPRHPSKIFIMALENLIKAKHLYSPDNLGAIFECLMYSFEDLLNHVRTNCKFPKITPGQQVYVRTLFTAVLTYIENFSFSWGDGVKALDLPQIMFDFLSSFDWSKEIVVKGLVLINQAISKRLSPCMSLLIDTPDSIKDLGPMLYKECYNTEWEIRKEALEVIRTIAINANKSFSSFKEILVKASLIDVVARMALTDSSPVVRATSFKCLKEFIIMEDVEHSLTCPIYINSVLEIIRVDSDTTTKSEAINFITYIYANEEDLPMDILADIYKHLESQALLNSNLEVRKASVEFWKMVTKKFFMDQGYLDRKFPPIVFSKRIITMTKKEIKSRMYKILTELSRNGCLDIFLNLFGSHTLHPEVAEIIQEFLGRFYRVFQEYEITPESMLNNNGLNLNNSSVMSPKSNNDTIIQELLNEPVVMLSDELNFYSDEDMLSVLDNPASLVVRPLTEHNQRENQKVRNTTPAEFVAFIFRKMSNTTEDSGTMLNENQPICDVYNIIDY